MSSTSAEAEILAVISARAQAVNDGDVDAMMASVAPDLAMFDVVDPLARKGIEAARQRATEWIDGYDGKVTWEDRDISVSAGERVAFAHCLSRVRGRLKTGAQIDMWFRKTLGFRKDNARWLVVHDHGSVPFDPQTGKASLGLRP